MSDDLKIRMPEWARNMYNRLLAKIDAGGGGGGDVTGVKGDAESTYRTGQVNLTPANIGAQPDVGFYIDAQGYLCQRIGSDT